MFLRIFLFSVILHGLCLSDGWATCRQQLLSSTDSVDILHYDINLDVTDIAGKKLKGHTCLLLTATYPEVYTLVLDLLKLDIDSVVFNNTTQAFSYNDTVISVNFPLPLGVTDTVLIDIYYHGTPIVEPYGWGGFHFSGSSMAYNLGIALQEVPPNYGRAWFPCIDNFTERAAFDFHITVNDPLSAVCNGTLIASVPQGNGTTVFHWKLEETMPAYLASVAVSNYIAVVDTFQGQQAVIPILLYVRPQDTTKVKNSFINLKQVLASFENRFGPYRWPRVGFVSTPLGAMEHATNIAYPTANIDGTLNSEWLYAHELSHMWFGDLVTCHSASDMWINEGWAVFCEGIFQEGVYGVTASKDYIRAKHHDVIKLTHHIDGGYYAVSGLPPHLTYGSTAYEQGGMVVHTLRGYLGDSLFFSSVKQYVDSFAFTDISSVHLRDFFSAASGVNLSDFFDTWVFNPGFPHFSIDSVHILPSAGMYHVTVYIRQRSAGTTHIAHSTVLEIGFGREDGYIAYDTLHFSGLYGVKTFVLPFSPAWTGIDPNEKTGDATTDNYRFFTGPSVAVFPQTYFAAEVMQSPDTAMIRAVHNWVPPDPFPQNIPGLTLSGTRYWTIEGIFPSGFSAKGRFAYSKFNFLDNDIITTSDDSLVLLYRPSCAFSWQSVPFTQSGPNQQGELVIDTLRPGEYTLAVWDRDFLGTEKVKNDRSFHIAPNPACKQFHLYLNTKEPGTIKIFNQSGALVDSLAFEGGKRIITWAPNQSLPGLYLFLLENNKKKKNISIKAVLLP